MPKLEESKVILSLDRNIWKTPREIRQAIFKSRFGENFEIIRSYSDKREDSLQARVFYSLLEEVHVCFKGIDKKFFESRAKELTEEEKLYTNSQTEYRLTEEGLKLQENYRTSVETEQHN